MIGHNHKLSFLLWFRHRAASTGSTFVWEKKNDIFSVDNWLKITVHENKSSLIIQNKISTISMHTLSLMKIHWHLIKLSSWNENTYGRMYDSLTDGQTLGRPTWYHNTRPLSGIKIHSYIGEPHYVTQLPGYVKNLTTTITFLCNFDPLKPYFYIVKLELTGVYIFFSYFCSKT